MSKERKPPMAAGTGPRSAGAELPRRRRAKRQGKDSPLFVASLEKGLRVLGAFDESRPLLRLYDIAAATGLDKSAAQRFAHSLLTLGYLNKDEQTKQYRLSPKVLELGFTYLRTDPLVERATPYLLECNKRCEETVNLTELHDTEVIYVARVPGRHVLSVDIILGTRFPAYCTAPGRAMMAFLPEAEARAIIDRSERRALTPGTVTDLAPLLDSLARVRETGFAIADQEIYIGDISVAAPVFDFSGRAVAAVNIAIPSPRWSARTVEEKLAPIVVETAAALSRAEGGGRGSNLTEI